MTTLDRRIIFYFSGQSVTGHSAGMYPYLLYRYASDETTSEVIFAGNFYYNGTDTSITFDVTDIVASDGWTVRQDDFQGVYTTNTKLMSKYFLIVSWGTGDSVTSFPEWVAKIHSYKNKNIAPYKNFVIYDADNSLVKKLVIPMIQSYVPDSASYNNGESLLIPHYPMYYDEQQQSENNCPYGLALKFGSEVSSTTLAFEVGPKRFDDIYTNVRTTTINKDGTSCAHISNVGNVADYRQLTPTSDGYAYLTDRQYVIDASSGGWDPLYPASGSYSSFCFVRYPSLDRTGNAYRYAFVYINDSIDMACDEITPDMLQSLDTDFLLYAKVEYPTAGSSDEKSLKRAANDVEYLVGDDAVWVKTYQTKVAVFDVCPKRYYLFWQDRYGSFQCQPFNDYANYSETFTKTEVQDYQNRRRNANIQVEGKWKLNSGWIDEKLYPYYESIYTSPLLILFDVEQNERFTVMVSGNYDEKTYRNQKKMINMNLELTENKKQNIIY